MSGQLLKWAVKLSEFNLQYQPRAAIKVQALTDFVAKSTPLQESRESTRPQESREEVSCTPMPTCSVHTASTHHEASLDTTPRGPDISETAPQAPGDHTPRLKAPDSLVPTPFEPSTPSLPSNVLGWRLYVDGSSTNEGGDTRLVLINPHVTSLKYVVSSTLLHQKKTKLNMRPSYQG